MPSVTRSLISLAALLAASPFAFARSLPQRKTFMPRQATPGFSGCVIPDGWENCNTNQNRSCWLKDPKGTEYTILTDYENITPPGRERTFDLEVSDEEITPDGVPKLAQLINKKYPGELIEACWGDTLIINVKNSLKSNGTTIHWHGIRQKGSNQMDGVNGVTQCPISEGDSFQYKFKLTQYGHTWYHSHYSSQYSEGVAAPMLIHGPHSEEWDEEWAPIMITDWLHESAYHAFAAEMIQGRPPPSADSILVDGIGRYGTTGDYFKARKFEAGRKYLIRIINASTGFHFQWSIDNHEFRVVSTDFVAIEPYTTKKLSVGIGQRYSVIVEAKPLTNSSDGKYWMRTEPACTTTFTGKAITENFEQTGIISYEGSSDIGLPSTSRHTDTVDCKDESEKRAIKPMLQWEVTQPQQTKQQLLDNTFEAGIDGTSAKGKWHNAYQRWSLTDTPLWLNFSDPVIMNLNNETWNPEYAIVDYNYDNDKQWVYLIITAGDIAEKLGSVGKGTGGGAHPIHLHGHDFAVIGQGSTTYNPETTPATFNLKNPARRDVAMLPARGYLAIAFKPDNPGAWIVHCHIAWHAGSGLALNILERQSEILGSLGGQSALTPVQNGCNKWDDWVSKNENDFNKFWPSRDQEDSGV